MKKEELDKKLKKIDKESESRTWFGALYDLMVFQIRLLNEILEKIK